ncbi:MAG: hypothetical protein IT395_03555 [Candidatus Omnitrophica bacterium]|nr:hypothetical protein [Candidatus Omnitrophota bacterium]
MKILRAILLLFVFGLAPNSLLAQEEPSSFVDQVQQANAVLDAMSSGAQAPAGEPAAVLPTTVFKLHFVRPQIVADKVRELMGAASGGVIVNEQSGELEISAPAEILEKIKILITGLDKAREISLDVKVVQVDLNEEHLPGINWSAIVSDYQSFTANEDRQKYSAGSVSSEDLPVLLEALETVGETKVYPVRTTNVKGAQDIDLRLKAFDRDVSVSMTTADPAKLNSMEKQDRYTARLLLSPMASGDDSVDLRLVSSDGTSVTLTIKNDAVAVIGGIFTQTKSESTKKFPFLGDVPLLGIVFRDQSKVVQRLENIMIVTPRVTTPAAQP